MYYGKGFTHSDVYSMPVYLRNFYYTKLTDTKKAEKKEADKSLSKTKSSGLSRPSIPRK